MDDEKDLSSYQPAVEIPAAEAVKADILEPDAPEEMPAVVSLLEELARMSVDPWSVEL